jgi:hypothetical protein
MLPGCCGVMKAEAHFSLFIAAMDALKSTGHSEFNRHMAHLSKFQINYYVLLSIRGSCTTTSCHFIFVSSFVFESCRDRLAKAAVP